MGLCEENFKKRVKIERRREVLALSVRVRTQGNYMHLCKTRLERRAKCQLKLYVYNVYILINLDT